MFWQSLNSNFRGQNLGGMGERYSHEVDSAGRKMKGGGTKPEGHLSSNETRLRIDQRMNTTVDVLLEELVERRSERSEG